MLTRLVPSAARPLSPFFLCSRTGFRSKTRMGLNNLHRRRANFRVCNVSSYSTELLEIHADNPNFNVLFIPGNPGIVSFYVDFVEYLHELLGGCASVTAVGHICHTKKDWEQGKLFSLQDQIDHKVDFIRQELQNNEVPLMLVGHSIGSYISIEIFNRFPEKVTCFIGLYPFLTLNRKSIVQHVIGKISASSIVCIALSSVVASLGLLPIWALRFVVRTSLGRSWSSNAIEAACSHLAKYHTMRNVLYMAMTEFRKLSETPDWAFIREKQDQIAFLFGDDDHWGPLQMLEEMSKHVPGISVSIEREGLTHGFCCTESGSFWVAQHVATLIKDKISCPVK